MTADTIDLAAPIRSVTVYPRGARVVRKGRVDLPAGVSRIVLDDLPLHLDTDSVRVSGVGAFTIHGVDTDIRRGAESPDLLIGELTAKRDAVRERARAIADALEVEDARAGFLDGLAEHAGASFARRLAGGHPADAAGFADDLAARHTELRTRRRALRAEGEQVERELAAAQRALDERPAQAAPDRMTVTVDVVAESAATGEIEVSYVVHGASWRSAYDVRYVDDTLAVTWYGLVTQHSGEDWPEVELALSTARVASAVRVPELDPWYLERVRPAPMARARSEMAIPAAKTYVSDEITLAGAAPAGMAVAAVEQGPVAATYRPARGVAVPADGQARRATIAVLDVACDLDYITVPVTGTEAYVRATAVNSSEYTLLPGRASVFNGAEFVGVTNLETWAPGEEVELALGVDDRVRVERKLKRHSAGRGFTTNRREAAFTIEVTNHTPRAARVSVVDQVPISRDEAISVKDVRLDPRSAAVSDLGEITWELNLEPGQGIVLTASFKVEIAKGVELRNWRD